MSIPDLYIGVQAGESTDRQLLERIGSQVGLVVDKVEELSAKVDVVAHNQAQECRADSAVGSPEAATSGTPTSAHGGSGSPPPAPKKRRIMQQMTLPGATFSSPLVVVSKPDTTVKLSDWTVAALFYNWYCGKMYIESPGVSQGVRDSMLLCAKLIAYCKCFLAAKTVIPSQPVGDASALCAWQHTMNRMSLVVEGEVVKHLLKHGVRLRQYKVYSTFKALQQLDVAVFPTPDVTDSAIAVAYTTCPCYHFGSITAVRSKRCKK